MSDKVKAQDYHTASADYRSFAYIEDVKASRQGDPPHLIEARAFLAPTRARALELLSEFQALCTELGPAFTRARELVKEAAKVGVHCTDLHNPVEEAFRLMEGGANSFRHIVAKIDTMEALYTLHGAHLQIPDQLGHMCANFGGLRDLHSKLPYLTRLVNERLGDKNAPRDPVLTPGSVPTLRESLDTTVKTDHGFDPRK